MDFGLLGTLRVRDGEREISIPRPKDRSVLAFLVLHARELVSLDRLLDELWGDRPPPTAKNSLQNSVSRLRKVLGADVLQTRPPGYVLEVADGDIDARLFERMLHEAHGHAAPERTTTLTRALALWRGSALADFEFESFALNEAPRLEELRLVAEEELVGAELEMGRHTELVPRIEDLVAHNPLREQLRAQLMVALYRSGRQAEALDAYQETRRMLLEELGIEPGPNLRELQGAILRQDAALAAPGSAHTEAVRPADLRARLATVTVLFVDVVAPEGLAPERHGTATTHAFHELRAATEYHGGTVERLAGDELMAVFGIPERHEDDALRAVRAAARIGRIMNRLPELEIHGALVTGEVVAPAPAAHRPITGSPVTLARRLAEAAPAGEIVADAATVELVRGASSVGRLTPLVVRGSSSPVPVFHVADAAERGRRPPRSHLAFVGRRDELGQMRQAFAHASKACRTEVLAVCGEPGVGKTRLSIELRESLESEAEIVFGSCVTYGEGRTWLPLREIARGCRAGVDRLRAIDAPAADRLEALLGGDVVPLTEAFWAARRFLEALALERPALVIVDDLHWAAPSFLDFVEHLRTSPAKAPVLVLGLARPELAGICPDMPTLTLAPLSEAEGRELIDAVADASTPNPILRRIADLGGGNPLFVEQLLAFVRDHGASALETVPPTVEALLGSRLDRLDAEARAVLQRAAVVGRKFRQAPVLHLSPPLEVPAVGRHLTDLARLGIVHTSQPTPERSDGFVFHHALLREVAYASIPHDERAALHEGVADWLGGEDEANDELVGYHLEQACHLLRESAPDSPHATGLAVAAGRRLASAGIRAHQGGDSAAAAALLARTVDVLPLADCVAADLLCELGVAEWSRGAAARAAATVERAVDAALSQRDLRAELRARIELAHLRLFVDAKDSTDELLELAAEAVPIFERYDDARSLGRTWLHVGFARGGVQRRNEEWRRAAEQALEHYRRTAWSPATCIGDLAAALMVGPVPARAARERCRELLAESHADRLSCAHVLVALAGLEAMLRRFARARRLIAEASATYEEIGFTRAVTSRANRNLGRIELLAQRPAAAAAVFRACCESFERDEDNGSLATTAAELAEALYRQGAHDEAEAWALVSAGRAAEDDLGAQYRWRGVMAKVLVGAGRLEEAEGLAREAVEITSRTDATNERGDALLSLAFVLRDSGDLRGASRTAEDGLVLFEEKENEAAAAQARSFLQAVALPSRR